MNRLLVPLSFLVFASAVYAGGGPENVLVVVNDLCPESVEIARYYITKRDIPRHHVVHVKIPGGGDGKKPEFVHREMLTWTEYETLLEAPVKAWLAANTGARITIIALTRGVPVVTEAKNSEKGNVPRATTHILAQMMVESDQLRTGPTGHVGVASPFHKHDESIDPATPIAGKWKIYSVGMLNAFSVDDVKRMIDASVASDAKRPDGTIYLGVSKKGDPRGSYNPQFPLVEEFCRKLGLKVETIPHAESGSLLEGKTDVAYYCFGQANWDEKFPAKNKYLPGSVVDNLTSVALTWRAFDPARSGGQTPMTHFSAAGASVIHGCVREPTTGAWDPAYLHVQRYLAGYNVIESFLMGHPWFPWMNLVAGDPLTQAYAERPAVTAELTGEKGAYKLKASAKATRDGAGIKSLTVYVDGVVAGEIGDAGELELKSFDPAVNSWKVVAVDDSRFRTVGVAASAPLAKTTSKVAVKYDSQFKGVATFKVTYGDKEPVLVWSAPDSKEKSGVVKGSKFTIAFESDKEAHTVDIWVKNAKSGPEWITIEVPKRR